MKLKVEIEIGNDAMLEGVDISAALVRVANKLRYYTASELKGGLGEFISDENGNRVGRWWVIR